MAWHAIDVLRLNFFCDNLSERTLFGSVRLLTRPQKSSIIGSDAGLSSLTTFSTLKPHSPTSKEQCSRTIIVESRWKVVTEANHSKSRDVNYFIVPLL